jgi:hypothetical protein
MKIDDLKLAATRAKVDIDDEINAFIQKLDHATNDPDNFISMTELEEEWRVLSNKTHKIYSDMVSQSLSAIDTRELNSAKKDNSSKKE